MTATADIHRMVIGDLLDDDASPFTPTKRHSLRTRNLDATHYLPLPADCYTPEYHTKPVVLVSA